jgi:hypothetical protein
MNEGRISEDELFRQNCLLIQMNQKQKHISVATTRTTTHLKQQHQRLLRQQKQQKEKEKELLPTFIRFFLKLLHRKGDHRYRRAMEIIQKCADNKHRHVPGYTSATEAAKEPLQALVGDLGWKAAWSLFYRTNNNNTNNPSPPNPREESSRTLTTTGRSTRNDEGPNTLDFCSKETLIEFIRFLMDLLQQKDRNSYRRAMDIIKDCADKKLRQVPGYDSQAEAAKQPLKALVGDSNWKKAWLLFYRTHNKKKNNNNLSQPSPREESITTLTTTGKSTATTTTITTACRNDDEDPNTLAAAAAAAAAYSKQTLAEFIHFLMDLLQQKDRNSYRRAMEIVQVCADKKLRQVPGYESQTEAAKQPLKALVGDQNWKKAWLLFYRTNKNKSVSQPNPWEESIPTLTTTGKSTATTITTCRNDEDPNTLATAAAGSKETLTEFIPFLMDLIQQKDRNNYRRAKEIIQDCADKKLRQVPGYESQAEAVKQPLKALVGAHNWKKSGAALLPHRQEQEQISITEERLIGSY